MGSVRRHSRKSRLLAKIAGAALYNRLCRTKILFLDLEDLGATADRIYDDSGDEGYGNSSVVAADGKVDEVPTLCPSSESRAGGKLNNHEDVV
jgi:hypothetical protein